jgi:glutamate racemase
MEPAVKPAVALTRSGKIAVLATPSTAASPRLLALIKRYGAGFDIRPIGVPGLADRIEAGDFDGPAVYDLLADRVRSQVADGVDVIVLGCTHYPFARGVIQELAGPDVRIVDSGNAVARRAREVMVQAGLLHGVGATPTLDVRTTGNPVAVQPLVGRMLGHAIDVTALCEHEPAMPVQMTTLA